MIEKRTCLECETTLAVSDFSQSDELCDSCFYAACTATICEHCKEIFPATDLEKGICSDCIKEMS